MFVADLQRHLEAAHVDNVLRQRVCPRCQSRTQGTGAGSSSREDGSPEGVDHHHDDQQQIQQLGDDRVVVNMSQVSKLGR